MLGVNLSVYLFGNSDHLHIFNVTHFKGLVTIKLSHPYWQPFHQTFYLFLIFCMWWVINSKSLKFTKQECDNFTHQWLSSVWVKWLEFTLASTLQHLHPHHPKITEKISEKKKEEKKNTFHQADTTTAEGKIRKWWWNSSQVQHLTVYWAQLYDFITAYLIQN